jgi:hypothetical protein
MNITLDTSPFLVLYVYEIFLYDPTGWQPELFETGAGRESRDGLCQIDAVPAPVS